MKDAHSVLCTHCKRPKKGTIAHERVKEDAINE